MFEPSGLRAQTQPKGLVKSNLKGFDVSLKTFLRYPVRNLLKSDGEMCNYNEAERTALRVLQERKSQHAQEMLPAQLFTQKPLDLELCPAPWAASLLLVTAFPGP